MTVVLSPGTQFRFLFSRTRKILPMTCPYCPIRRAVCVVRFTNGRKTGPSLAGKTKREEKNGKRKWRKKTERVRDRCRSVNTRGRCPLEIIVANTNKRANMREGGDGKNAVKSYIRIQGIPSCSSSRLFPFVITYIIQRRPVLVGHRVESFNCNIP